MSSSNSNNSAIQKETVTQSIKFSYLAKIAKLETLVNEVRKSIAEYKFSSANKSQKRNSATTATATSPLVDTTTPSNRHNSMQKRPILIAPRRHSSSTSLLAVPPKRSSTQPSRSGSSQLFAELSADEHRKCSQLFHAFQNGITDIECLQLLLKNCDTFISLEDLQAQLDTFDFHFSATSQMYLETFLSFMQMMKASYKILSQNPESDAIEAFVAVGGKSDCSGEVLVKDIDNLCKIFGLSSFDVLNADNDVFSGFLNNVSMNTDPATPCTTSSSLPPKKLPSVGFLQFKSLFADKIEEKLVEDSQFISVFPKDSFDEEFLIRLPSVSKGHISPTAQKFQENSEDTKRGATSSFQQQHSQLRLYNSGDAFSSSSNVFSDERGNYFHQKKFDRIMTRHTNRVSRRTSACADSDSRCDDVGKIVSPKYIRDLIWQPEEDRQRALLKLRTPTVPRAPLCLCRQEAFEAEVKKRVQMRLESGKSDSALIEQSKKHAAFVPQAIFHAKKIKMMTNNNNKRTGIFISENKDTRLPCEEDSNSYEKSPEASSFRSSSRLLPYLPQQAFPILPQGFINPSLPFPRYSEDFLPEL